MKFLGIVELLNKLIDGLKFVYEFFKKSDKEKRLEGNKEFDNAIKEGDASRGKEIDNRDLSDAIGKRVSRGK